MRIACVDFDDFIENIHEQNLYNDSVFVSKSRRSLNNGASIREATSVQVILQLSAIIDYADGGQALLECGIDCGVDRLTADGDTEGSATLKDLCDRLKAYCDERELRIRPGLLDF